MIPLIQNPDELSAWKIAQHGKRIALVPTMGNLHAGHMALVKEAQRHGEVVLLSIFVNPTQFGAGEDLEQYPRSLEADMKACQDAKVDAILVPSIDWMYPRGLDLEHRFNVVPPRSLSARLCGKDRPGHFDGVATIVLKLLLQVQPQVVVFGEKDAQQVVILKALLEEFALPIAFHLHPVVRDATGLALSSRNQYLKTAEARHTALALIETMQGIATAFHHLAPQPLSLQKAFELSWQALKPLYPLGEGLHWDYVEAVDADTFAPQDILTENSRLLVAARLEGVRLIDTLHVQAVRKT